MKILTTLSTTAAALVAAALAGCATAPPPAPPAPAPRVELPFAQAVAQAADGLLLQLQKQAGRSVPAPAGIRRGLMVDPMIDAGSAQQTGATQSLQAQVLARMSAQDGAIEVLPFQPANLTRARLLLTGTLTRIAPGQPQGTLRIDLALTELANGIVVAQDSALTRDEGLDHTPLPYYRDVPVPARDPMTDGYVRTTAMQPGQRAEPYYLERIAVAPLIEHATRLYNAKRYQDALLQYGAAGDLAAGEQLRVLNGVYLSAARLGRTAESERAFGRIVAWGIANRQLGVKFLFNPGGTVFWSESKVSGPYAMWLREIAKASAGAKVCMDIVGHTSRTGPVALNDELSLQRARYVRQKLVAKSVTLKTRTTPTGVGFRENIIGSGTDDAADALDRRVEFRVVNCQRERASGAS